MGSKHLLSAIVDECRNSDTFTVKKNRPFVNIYIDMGSYADFEYTLDEKLFEKIGEELQKIYNIKAAEAAERKQANG